MLRPVSYVILIGASKTEPHEIKATGALKARLWSVYFQQNFLAFQNFHHLERERVEVSAAVSRTPDQIFLTVYAICNLYTGKLLVDGTLIGQNCSQAVFPGTPDRSSLYALA